MFTFALCDDDMEWLEIVSRKLKDILHSGGMQGIVQIYNESAGLLRDISKEVFYFDAVFLDIEMLGETGFEVADRIINMNRNISIVFCSNYDDYVYSSFRYNAFRYIRKSNLDIDLEEAVCSLIKKTVNETSVYEVGTDRKKIQLKLRDIVYIESNLHNSYIHITSSERPYVLRKKISNFEDELNDKYFIRVHMSYVVNLKFVKDIRRDGVYLDNGNTIPVSRSRYEESQSAFIRYMRFTSVGRP